MRRALATVLLAGCHSMVVHGRDNAMGNIPVTVPPPDDLKVGQIMRPQDPGEKAVSFGLGPWTAYAIDDDGNSTGAWGVELEVLFADQDHSHVGDELFGSGLIEGAGFDLGATWYGTGATLGPIYLEALSPQFPTIVRMGVGLAWDPHTAQAGPQLSMSFFGFYTRAQVLFGEENSAIFSFGFVLEPPVTFSHSR